MTIASAARLICGMSVALSLSFTPAPAQQRDGCWITRDGTSAFGNNTPAYYDEPSTRNWMRVLQLADAQAMAAHAGTYYAEIPAPQLGMINYQYRRLDADGGFQYQDRTCSAVSCSQNQGYGRWAGVRQGDGSIYIMVNFTDLIRQSACFSWVGRLNGSVFSTADGSAWQKVQ